MLYNEQTEQNEVFVKCVLVGDFGVGKSSIMDCFANECYPQQEKFVPEDNFDFCERKLKYGSQDVFFSLHETSSSEEDERRRILSYEGAKIFIIVFSLDDVYSLLNVRRKWFPEIQDHSPGSLIVLLGNKTDLMSGENPWKVYDRGEQLARELSIRLYLGVSTVQKKGIDVPPKYKFMKEFEKIVEFAVDPDPFHYTYEKFKYGRFGHFCSLLFLSLLSHCFAPGWLLVMISNWVTRSYIPDFKTEILIPFLLVIPVCLCWPVIMCVTFIVAGLYVCFFGDYEEGGWFWGETVLRRKSKHSRCAIL